MINQFISDAGALFMLWIFAQAGFHKIKSSNNHYYRSLIADYFNLGSLTQVKLTPLVKIIGAIEIALALAVVINTSRPFTALAIATVLLTYFSVMAYQLYQGKRNIDCGCGGPAGQLKISKYLLVRNLLFVGIALLCQLPIESQQISLSLLAFLFATSAILLNLMAEQIIANHQKLTTLNNY